jgi:hypothetical protein
VKFDIVEESCEFKMRPMKIFFFAVIGFVCAKNFKFPSDSNQNVLSYVKFALSNSNSNDIQIRDVIVIRCGFVKESAKNLDDLYQSIVDIIPTKNPVREIDFGHFSTRGKMRKAEMVIVVNDEFSKVEFCCFDSFEAWKLILEYSHRKISSLSHDG